MKSNNNVNNSTNNLGNLLSCCHFGSGLGVSFVCFNDVLTTLMISSVRVTSMLTCLSQDLKTEASLLNFKTILGSLMRYIDYVFMW